ncbi:MAG TPA: lipase maturation factor family protein [Vicinamibacterales bacterium]|nr:lipase maturation factor family protein [Vicinamibacterales bacterium]
MWRSRFLFERALGCVYLIAFLVTANQFVALLGEHGLVPVPLFTDNVPFSSSPSLFYFAHTDAVFRICAWVGVALSALAITAIPQRIGTWAAALCWAALWLLYLSFVNVGQIFYGFGWETLLLETGFLAIFLGAWDTEPSRLLNYLARWIAFRIMFGAGLIKLRGDACWRNLTCLDYYFETQPIPNPLSWYFHWLPAPVHHAGVLINHFAELIVPWALFAPQPIASIAAVITILFQLTLIASGNLSWLNWLTIVVAIPAIDDRWLAWMPVRVPALKKRSSRHQQAVYVLTAAVVLLSIAPAANLFSSSQMMNSSFEPLHIVNTYGAFGSVTDVRNEIVVEGTSDSALTDHTVWREYEFRGKPGDPARMPPQIAPYHLRLDWLMWFAAMEPPEEHAQWFDPMIQKRLAGDRATLSLLRTNPFADAPPRFIRAELFRYTFTTPGERHATGRWWNRESAGRLYMRPTSAEGITPVAR